MTALRVTVDVLLDEGRIYATVRLGDAWTRYRLIDGAGYVRDAALELDSAGEMPASDLERLAVAGYQQHGPDDRWSVALDLHEDGRIEVVAAIDPYTGEADPTMAEFAEFIGAEMGGEA